MDALCMISKRALRELLVKGWMTHDAMWLQQSIEACGAEKASTMNSAVVEAMALIEIQRIKKVLRSTSNPVKNFDELKMVIEGAFSLIKGEFMKFDFSFPEENVFQWEWTNGSCFAHKGVKQLGITDYYQCGLMLRVTTWLKGLGVEYLVEPEIDGCLMNSNETCSGRILFNYEV